MHMTMRLFILALGLLRLSITVHSWTTTSPTSPMFRTTALHATNNNKFTRRSILSIGGALLGTTSLPGPSQAKPKDRTRGYTVQHSEDEWKRQLSSQQNYILRQGGTERPNSSVLEREERPGVYACAGCSTPLFASSAKFHSGTGWPSFASFVDQNVQVENVSALAKTLGGAELRCASCGGHLGDVFQDGFLFVGTPAFATGQRYCIDGGALVFIPSGGGASVRGDLKPTIMEPSWLSPPKISPREAV